MEYPIPVSQLRERYLKVYAAAVNDVLRLEYKMLHQSLSSDYQPLHSDVPMAGAAFTVKGMPCLKTEAEMENRAAMLAALPEDSISIWDCTGDVCTAQWGEVMTMAARQRGCRGAVVNGLRDVQRVRPQEFQVFYRYRSTSGMLGRFRVVDYQIPVLMDETLIYPGDFVVGDTDGLIVVPKDIVLAVLEKAEAIVNREQEIKRWVSDGIDPQEVVRRGGYF